MGRLFFNWCARVDCSFKDLSVVYLALPFSDSGGDAPGQGFAADPHDSANSSSLGALQYLHALYASYLQHRSIKGCDNIQDLQFA